MKREEEERIQKELRIQKEREEELLRKEREEVERIWKEEVERIQREEGLFAAAASTADYHSFDNLAHRATLSLLYHCPCDDYPPLLHSDYL